MNRSTMIRRGVATGIAGAGLAVAGLGIASASEDGAGSESPNSAASSSTDTGSGERGDRGRGPGGSRGPGGPDLAEALGVSESDLQAAFDSIREQREPSPAERSSPSPDGERDDRRDQVAAALAEQLDLSEADVTEAFEQLQQDRVEERRGALGERLDEAVTGGDLTSEDRASVLEAFDAGVLGGGPEGARGAR